MTAVKGCFELVFWGRFVFPFFSFSPGFGRKKRENVYLLLFEDLSKTFSCVSVPAKAMTAASGGFQSRFIFTGIVLRYFYDCSENKFFPTRRQRKKRLWNTIPFCVSQRLAWLLLQLPCG